MAELAKQLSVVAIEEELQKSYLDYAMSVIVGRALPDVRDGLKPVHRRVLFAMLELGNDWNKPYKKSARIVGDVIGKYHPHGDAAVYDTIVRLAQPFSMRYQLVDGQGNFGSIDGDSPAAMRYTEIRLAKIAHSLLIDLDKETVDFTPNYDETELIPVVLPTRVPNLLVNGSSGIAVGMATNIPPHNLGEVISACLATLDNPEITIDSLLQHIPGPDFPTAAIINGRAGIIEAYRTGRGKIYIRSRVEIELDEDSGKQAIIIKELPYQVNKAKLLEKIGELVKEKRIEGITAVRDESDREGMRVVIELRRGEIAEVILNNLFMNTQMEVVFGINIVALDNGQPKVLNLKELIQAFLAHRKQVVLRRSAFELKQARARAHLLEGLGIALTNIDEMVALIKASKTPAIAKEQLLAKTWRAGIVATMLAETNANISKPLDLDKGYGLIEGGYKLSEAQAQAILELRLQRLTALEQDKIFLEYKELLELIQKLLDILAKPELLIEVVRTELTEIKDAFADSRRTEIIDSQQDLTREDLITPEEVVVTLSHEGYAKIQAVSDYQAQHRGGRGKAAASVREEDFIEHLFIANTHDTILCFSSIGKVYWLKVYLLPQGSRTSRGKPLVNLFPLEEGERINTILPIKNYSANQFVFMATSKGLVKKVSLDSFSNPRANGIIAVELKDDDHLVKVDLTDGNSDILLFTDAGKVIRFSESQVRAVGRTAIGVRGIKLKEDQKVIAMVVIKDKNGAILTATLNGYGKRTDINNYPAINRGGQGVVSIQVTERNGNVVKALQVAETDEIMLISDFGTLVRIPVSEVSVVGRNTQGVKLINLNEGEKLIGLEKLMGEIVSS